MKRNPNQGVLFPTTRRVVVNCTKCKREIVVQDPSADGTSVYSEFLGPEGRCWNCTYPAKKRHA